MAERWRKRWPRDSQEMADGQPRETAEDRCSRDVAALRASESESACLGTISEVSAAPCPGSKTKTTRGRARHSSERARSGTKRRTNCEFLQGMRGVYRREAQAQRWRRMGGEGSLTGQTP